MLYIIGLSFRIIDKVLSSIQSLPIRGSPKYRKKFVGLLVVKKKINNMVFEIDLSLTIYT